jgi:glycosyltransferase involved in cell wall biosynthesis
VKLVIQIPCLNERDHLGQTFADLPRQVPGVDEIEVLVIDDGSTDGTREVAAELGVHHIVRFPRHRGLSAAFMAGLDASLRLGADVIVNTDADNQYRGADIARLVEPIVAGRADIVVGDREPGKIKQFSLLKRLLQGWGSSVVRRVSGTRVADSTSGFRALGRKAAYSAFVHNRFTYTLETIIQAGRADLVIENVKIGVNPKTRESRLFSSIPAYIRRNGPVIFRAYGMYRPVQTFAYVAVVLLLVGLAMVGRFAYIYVRTPLHSGHTQSLVVGVGAVILSFMVALVAMLSDLLAMNRRLLEEALSRIRRLDAKLARASFDERPDRVEGVESTGAAAWRGDAP